MFARIAIWALPVFFVLMLAGFLGLRTWFNAWLESADFRDLIGGITSKQLKARGEYLPFHFSGATIYSDGFKARGTAKAAFSELGADQIRAEINLRGLWDHAWEIDEINIQRVQAALGHTAAPAVAEDQSGIAPEQPAPPSGPRFDWLPKRLDLRRIVIHETDLTWGKNTPWNGSMKGSTVTIVPDGEAWSIFCERGAISQNGQPDLTLDSARLRYQRPSLFITDGQLRYGESGAIAVSGEVNFEKILGVQAKFIGIPLTPFLREDWRAKLKGNIFGDVKIRSPLPLPAMPEISGKLNLAQGELEALPVLDQIAVFTRTERFRKIGLSKASADFVCAAGKTTVTNFVAESEGLIRIEGGFVVENAMIDGAFQVGVTPASLQWLPGSQEKVFTVAHGGYLWTTMRLTGAVDHPNEDLTQRLVAAAGGTLIDTVQSLIQEVPKTDLPDVPKKLIDDFVTPLIKEGDW